MVACTSKHLSHFDQKYLEQYAKNKWSILMIFEGILPIYHGGSTPLSSWTPRALKKKSTFYIKDHQNRSIFFHFFVMSKYTQYLLDTEKL